MEMESILRGSFVSLASKGYPNRCHTPIGVAKNATLTPALGRVSLRRSTRTRLTGLVLTLASLQHPVKRRDRQEERHETRDRVLQTFHVEGADRDGDESDQGGDLRVGRERQADRQQSDARPTQRAAKGNVCEQDNDPYEEHAGDRDSVEQQEGPSGRKDGEQDSGHHPAGRRKQGEGWNAILAHATERLRHVAIA